MDTALGACISVIPISTTYLRVLTDFTYTYLVPTYLLTYQVFHSMRAHDRMQKAQLRQNWRPAQLRRAPQCAVAVVKQESTFARSRCIAMSRNAYQHQRHRMP